MPPRAAPTGGRGGPAIRGLRGAAPRGRGGSVSVGLPTAGDHISTIGVKRSGFGASGRPVKIFVNSFECTIPKSIIHHYDGMFILPSEKTLPARLNMELIKELQTTTAPAIFTPRAVYDGRKNLFAARELPFDGANYMEFSVTLPPTDASSRAPKAYKIRLTKVAEINPEVLHRFIKGDQSHDNSVLTAITALNVVIRMEPSLNYPFNVRSFFTSRETLDIGCGLQLWRGYFQSVRPAMDRMLINVDISTGTMYKEGKLIDLCLQFLGSEYPEAMSPKRGLPDRERLRLQRFITGMRIRVLGKTLGPKEKATEGDCIGPHRVVKKLSAVGASSVTFTNADGVTTTVADHFRRSASGIRLNWPDNICVEVGSGALIPLELCFITKGQIMRKQVPPSLTPKVLSFATKKPRDRLASIRNGLEVLAYGQSDYVRHFGMSVNSAAGPLQIQARILHPPTLKYGTGSKQATIVPRDGAWNMVDKRFFRPAQVGVWAVVIYEQRNRFDDRACAEMVQSLSRSCREVGMVIKPPAVTIWQNGQGTVQSHLQTAGLKCKQAVGAFPSLIVVILPEHGDDIYTAVKHFGDVTAGVATQCMKSKKCFGAKNQYFANVCLKMNVKLGGINVIPDPTSVRLLTDPATPTIVMGADVIHPAPGSDSRPSFTALVANVDSDTAKYIATTRVQNCRQEMIEDLQEMSKHVLSNYMNYRSHVEKKAQGMAEPKRILFFRDGVSEGQFQEVLDKELGALKRACEELRIKPKITVIVVGKRHHVRFFPTNEKEGDRSGNCPAGTVVDRDISHPTEFDFYLQSHGGLLGTSRPAHYSVLYDENALTPDAVQSLSFALCHVYARSTRSVSIPAPVYYADIVCSRAKNHYDPSGSVDYSESGDGSKADESLDAFKRGFKPLHAAQSKLMYFSVRRLNLFDLAHKLTCYYSNL
ncbi:argonaute-like protein [Armillaria gallica]|uniref:Argonaute-like protein n=1 Tax=Armillaria gallica TaxID=47427 RepID=A0A2H3EIR2_ARMGA|nr:argonaute-like protein [Armillaria gallica]